MWSHLKNVEIPTKNRIVSDPVSMAEGMGPFRLRLRLAFSWPTRASPHTKSKTGLSSGTSLYVNSVYFGSCAISQFGGAIDAAFVPRSNSSFTATNYMSGCSRTLKSNTVVQFNWLIIVFWFFLHTPRAHCSGSVIFYGQRYLIFMCYYLHKLRHGNI